MLTKLSSKLVIYDAKPMFQLSMTMKPTGTIPILEFEFPLMDTQALKEMIQGIDSEDQNDDGFFIRIEEKMVHIKMYRDSDSEDTQSVDITLPFEVCKQTFIDLLPLYEARDRVLEANDYEEEPKKKTMKLPCDECYEMHSVDRLYMLQNSKKRIIFVCNDDIPDAENEWVMMDAWTPEELFEKYQKREPNVLLVL